MTEQTSKFSKGGLALALAALALAGCTSTISRNVNDQGVAEEVIFPTITKDEGVRGGVFPNVENLRKIAPGVTREDLYHLIGRPHFSEMNGAREWDYVLKFRETVGGPVTVCQYKVLFDTDKKARHFHWKPDSCANFLKDKPAPAPAPVVVVPAPAPAPRKVSLSADALFAFNKSGLEDLQPKGRGELDALAAEVLATDPDARFTVTGHADRLGGAAYNLNLSQERAETVREYLIGKGVPAGNIKAVGVGQQQPVVQCNDRNRQALVACLAPNRRVDVEVHSAP